MKIDLSNDPNYEQVFESKIHDGLRFYVPGQTAMYHTSRLLAARAQDIFSNAGTTRDYLVALSDEILRLCEDEKSKTNLRTSVGTLMNNLKYRLQYPVDELCAIRMGALLTFAEDEDPNQLFDRLTQRKIEMAMGSTSKGITPDPELYTFFLSWGLANTTSYREQYQDIDITEYLANRELQLNRLTPAAES